MKTSAILVAVVMLVGLACMTPEAQAFGHHRRVVAYPAPVTAYYAPAPGYYAPPVPVTYYAPAPEPVYYAPAPAPVTTYYAPAPVTAYYGPPAPVVYGRPAVVRTKVYYPGQPVRNFAKAITW